MAVRISCFCDYCLIIAIGCRAGGIEKAMNKKNPPANRRSTLTLPNFDVFMPTTGDKIEKISGSRVTTHRQEGGNCKTILKSGVARGIAVPSRPMYRSKSRKKAVPLLKKGRKLAQGVPCEPSQCEVKKQKQ